MIRRRKAGSLPFVPCPRTIRRSMRTLHAWMIFWWNVIHYSLYRLGLMRPPDFRNYPDDWDPWLGSLLGWRRGLRIVQAENCPKTHPAVFAAGHGKLDDPLFVWGAVNRASAEQIHIHFMMRDDFFVGPPWSWLPFSMNELTRMSGCIQISRDQVQLSQLKPLINILRAPGSFVMFPGRSRSRSGLLMEYRDGIEEPGGVSFFVVHAQRRSPELRIPAVPVARTYNPVTRSSVVAFAPPLFLETGASRDAQRDFDLALAVRIGDAVELHALHLVSAILYLRCLHGACGAVPEARLCAQTAAVVAALPDRLMDPALRADPDAAVRAALRWLAKAGMVRHSAPGWQPDAPKILAAPALENDYRKRNPVKYHINQLLHFDDVVRLLNAEALRGLSTEG